MAKGEAPFDAAKAQAVFKTYSDSAKKAQTLFPDTAKTGGETTAAPKIWEDMAGFKAAEDKFLANTKEAVASPPGDVDGLKAQLNTLGGDCGACHQSYRVKKS